MHYFHGFAVFHGDQAGRTYQVALLVSDVLHFFIILLITELGPYQFKLPRPFCDGLPHCQRVGNLLEYQVWKCSQYDQGHAIVELFPACQQGRVSQGEFGIERPEPVILLCISFVSSL